jgi:hypothetical protein
MSTDSVLTLVFVVPTPTSLLFVSISPLENIFGVFSFCGSAVSSSPMIGWHKMVDLYLIKMGYGVIISVQK